MLKNEIEFIKMQMEENLKELKEYQDRQLKMYEELIKINDIDELDYRIEDFREELRFTTILEDIVYIEKKNFESLMNLAWKNNSKVKANA